MEANIVYDNLVKVLEEEVTVYRHLLELVRNERQILINSDLEELNENNLSKEAMIAKIRQLEKQREEKASEAARVMGADIHNPRLLDIAQKYDLQRGDKLRSIHTALNLLVKRLKDVNKRNENLIETALGNIQGAIKNLKTSVSEKNVYKKQGKVSDAKTHPGQLVSKEA